MQIKKEFGNRFSVELSGYELASLISSARWITEGSKGEFPEEALQNLKRLLKNYDKAAEQLYDHKPTK
ncbi:MAG: hypothetical protein HKN99_11505 [Winogradskyella sp.]|nr:hypothetical protein [Winogradskyella sp.]MBT8376215.1 hypothetical protein [Bacteroidia bacterium]NNC46500.1 hypothetical protein [Winogradskyella sp.]NNL82049.1 hypothetical protein [Winogradskyella sp.]